MENSKPKYDNAEKVQSTGKNDREVGKENPIRIGISIGDINGIGPEIIIKAFSDHRLLLDCTPIIYGSTKVLSHHKKLLENNDFAYQSCKSADDATNRKVNVVNVWDEETQFDLGKPTETGGKYAFMSLERATQDLASGKIDVLVTAPISKDAMSKSGFKFPGHTEYLASLAGEEDALMVMVSGSLRVALVTSHIALKEVSAALTKEKILAKIVSFEKSLRKDFGIIRPKIAVFGVNPHAGENGKMGTEEGETILPAINLAKDKNILCFGPFPADGFFGSDARTHYDGVLAMYHDQGLAAFKALAFEDGVNFTAGLPIVRTSPDHGTAYDIVGKNCASPQSFLSAMYLAMDIHASNQRFKEISANVLPISKEDPRKSKRALEE